MLRGEPPDRRPRVEGRPTEAPNVSTRPTLRPARPDDYPGFTRLFTELRIPDDTPSRERWIAELVPQALVAEQDGAVLGYALWAATGPSGSLRHLAVDPAARRQGLGRALLAASADLLRARGCVDWRINVRPDNAPALALYESVGFVRCHASCAVRLDWTILEALPRAARPVAAEEILPAADAEIEARLDLAPGVIAEARLHGGRALRALRAREPQRELLGVAVFDPGFPGAFPFRVEHPGFARPLLEDLRTFARPEVPWVQVVVEGDAPLADVLVRAGARVAVAFEHYRGPLSPVAGDA
jgi:GNAT superfamily N-acetyltransferase